MSFRSSDDVDQMQYFFNTTLTTELLPSSILHTNNSSTEKQHIAGTVVICFLSGIASLITTGGNVLVAASFAIDKELRKNTYNYLLLSLAAADFMVGLISMNLFTIFIVKERWTLGPLLCDIWLAMDYVASNASVMNLLMICLDR